VVAGEWGDSRPSDILPTTVGSEGKSVKALTRGLGVLAAINELSPATVTRLVEETGYPKATVIRLVQTLCREGYATVERVTACRIARCRFPVGWRRNGATSWHRSTSSALSEPG